MAREIRVEIVGDSRDLGRATRDARNDLDRLDGSFSRVSSGAGRMGAAVAAGLAGGAIIVGRFVGSAISSASDLGETVSLVNTVFGQSAPKMQAWSRTAAQSFGQSRNQALRAAGAFGNMFVQLGIGQETAGDMSQAMTELSADFASFHNADSEEVITAMTAAFRGEYDALQRFVPVINAALVQQKALEMTGKDNADALTMQEKALATYQLVLEGAGDAMGDFDRTSDSLANQQRILNAEWENAKATLGEALLPVMTNVTSWLAEHLPAAIETAKGVVDDIKTKWEEFTTLLFGDEDWDSFWTDVSNGWVQFQADWDTFTDGLKTGWQEFVSIVSEEGPARDGFFERHKRGVQAFIDWGKEHAPWLFGEGFPFEGGPAGNLATDTPISSSFDPSFGLGDDGPGPLPSAPALPPQQWSLLPPAMLPRSVVQNDPSWGMRKLTGPFADGGVVPGRLGSPQLAMVHAGETVLPTHKSAMGGNTYVFYGEPDQFIMKVADAAGGHGASGVRRDLNWSI